MTTFPHHERLRLVNFTAFADASFEWSPGINAIIGTNGTGKTHLLKVLYAVQAPWWRRKLMGRFRSLSNVFQINDAAALLRQEAQLKNWQVIGNWKDDDINWSVSWNEGDVVREDKGKTGLTAVVSSLDQVPRPVFIPTADMMGHTKRFGSTYDQYEIDFDQTYRDIVSALLSPPLRDQSQVADALKSLSKVLGGEVEEEGERFYLRTSHGRQPMPLVAEGLRKIATLYTLIKNGYLQPGDTLFWDEPETNLNPTLMDEVVAALLALARSGVQIFLTTHSYFVLQELDLQATKTDNIRYFNLYPSPDGTQVEVSDDFAMLEHNAIMQQADYVYDRVLTRATGRKRKK